MGMTKAALIAALLWGVVEPAAAQSGAVSADGGTSSAEPALCTDRPTKSNAVCTVPEGKFQIETDLPNRTRNTDGGTRTDVVLYANPYVQYGFGPNTDVEVNWAPYETICVRGGGPSTS